MTASRDVDVLNCCYLRLNYFAIEPRKEPDNNYFSTRIRFFVFHDNDFGAKTVCPTFKRQKESKNGVKLRQSRVQRFDEKFRVIPPSPPINNSKYYLRPVSI